MTLIASIMGNEWFYQISDVLVTRDSTEDHLFENGPLVFSNNGTVSGFIRTGYIKKTISIDGKMIGSFAGNVMQGVTGLKMMRDQFPSMYDSNSLEPFSTSISNEYSQINEVDVSFIISMMRSDKDNSLINNSIGCSVHDFEDVKIRCSGSGSSLFLDPNFTSSFRSMNFLDRNAGDSASQFVLGRIPSLFLLASLDDSFDYFRFGGWYEIMTISQEGFHNFDYAVAILSDLHPRQEVQAYARRVDIDGMTFIVDLRIHDQCLKNVDIRVFALRDPFSPSQVSKRTLQELAIKSVEQAMLFQPEGMFIIAQRTPGKLAVGYTAKLPFHFVRTGGIELIVNEENSRLLSYRLSSSL